MNLRTKFHIASAILILTVVIGMMASLYSTEKSQLKAEIEQEQSVELTKLANLCDDAMLGDDELVVLNYVKQSSLVSPQIAFSGFVSRAGSGWVFSRPEAVEKNDLKNPPMRILEATDPYVQMLLKSSGLMVRDVVGDKGERITAMSKALNKFGGRSNGYVWLGFSNDVADQLLRDRIKEKFQRFRNVGIIAVLIGLVLAQLMSRTLSKPVNLLMKAADEIGKGTKGVQIPVCGKDELAKLTETFNHMSTELNKLDEMKDDFMSHVTHELRSPLTSIIATVELMGDNPLMKKDEKLKRSLDRLTYGSERLNKLVDNILDLTRMEAGKMPFYIQPLNVGLVAVEMADFFEPRAMEKELTIKAEVPENLPLALGDIEKIRQILSNLIYNAIKFTNKGGITLWVRLKDKMIQVGVQDSGVGIPKDKLQSVFGKFECLQDTRNRVDKPVPGSGLGLNIVQNSIKAQGGTVWVESEMDKGSTFIFTLPLAPVKPASEAQDTKTQTASSSVDAKREPVLMQMRGPVS